uniref:Lysine methyltransferase 2C n=1 Tax=Tetraodon nigroviridis TaxID=99883 RepID=H3D7P3_TETNG
RATPKGGGSNQCAPPPAPPQPPPAPPPGPRSRTKSRSRSREVKDKTTGGRRSKRRSNTNPEPCQEPEPEPDPEPSQEPEPDPEPCQEPEHEPDPEPIEEPGPEPDPKPSQTGSEDCGGSGPAVLVHSTKFLKQCAFCYRGDSQAPLGQGHLMVFGPTPGYVPLHILNRRASSDRDNDCHDYGYGGGRTPSTPPLTQAFVSLTWCSSPEQLTESSSEFVEQLGPVGLPHDLSIQSLFDPTAGQCCAHLQCAAWSEGVCCGEGQSLLYVDKAIDWGSTQVCAYCQRLGASLRCWEANCRRSYHFPCAAAAGAQQDWTDRRTLCTKHSPTVSAVTPPCQLCSSGGDGSSLLTCCCCGNCYHGNCLDPPVIPNPLRRAGWQCPRCRVCQSCRLRGNDGMLLVCEHCDKAYHTHCLTPPLEHSPGSGWSCKSCRICRGCGVRSSGQWANHPFLCKSCDPALPCPVCDGSPDPCNPQETLTCVSCYRCVHTDCTVGWQREGRAGPEDYLCSTCRTLPYLDQHSPPAPPGDAEELHSNAPTSQHSPGQQLDDSAPPQPFHPDHNLAACHQDQEEHQHHPAASPQGQTEPQLDSETPHPQATEPQHSPVAPEEDLTESHQSPSPHHLESQALQQSQAPLHQDAVEAGSSHAAPDAEPFRFSVSQNPPVGKPHRQTLPVRSGAVIKQDSPKPLSAPCSPPPSQPPSRRSVSLPASPAHSQVQLASSQLAVQSEVNGSMPSCSNLPEASACAQAPSPPAGTSSPADSEEMAAEEISEVPPQEEQTEESGESKDPRGESLPEEQCSSFSCPPPGLSFRFLPSQAVPTPLLPYPPKIGMGKPAISKRKFSPARARIKQGSCWSNRRVVSPPSSSQDSMGESGWDSPKPHPTDPPLWSLRVGRGSGFPGRRRSRGGGAGGGRGARGRSRLKTQDSLTVLPGVISVEAFQPKEEEENSMHNTVVMFSTTDHFTLKQDMCVVCGSFGQGAEGRLLACSQCGQCYHPFCVNVKMTRVVLTKGWRCLECTVCEACGEASDPGRLLLCDDCDISYHTYCLDPPLHTVPKGAWKCKWCVRCVQCGSSSPGVRCDWQDNYSCCGPCGSLRRCPLCQRPYAHDELIMQCQQCDRWVHATCQNLMCEEDVEAAADEGFDCSLCRSPGSYGRCDSFSSPHMVQISSRLREPDSKTFTQDGVCLTESGLTHLQSLVEPLMSPRRYRRCKPKLKLRIINQNSVSVLQTPAEPDTPTEQEHGGQRSRRCPQQSFQGCELDCDLKSDSSPEREQSHSYEVGGEPELPDGSKKRKRKPYRPGIGGFMVRQRGGKVGVSRIKLCRRDSSELLSRDEGCPDVPMETTPLVDHAPGKVKKRYRKKKTKLEEVFPSYLQEAFFGKDLLDQSRQKHQPIRNITRGQEKAHPSHRGRRHEESGNAALASSSLHHFIGLTAMSDGALLDLSEVLITDPQILATGHTAGLDLTSVAEDPSFTAGGGCGQRMVQEEPLDAILSPELDKMVTDGAILSKLYKIPELEGKDVEEVFTAVLHPNNGDNNQLEQRQNNTAAGKTHTPQTAVGFPRLGLMNGLMGAAPQSTNAAVMSSGAKGPGGFRLGSADSHVPAPASDHSHGQALTNQSPAAEGEQDGLSTAQRSMLKWEKEEALGEMATVAPVLYCNTNFPQLREQYPDWSTRVKQIAKLWRKACSQDRAPFVQKARDNRAAQRISKVQLANDPVKRQPATPAPLPAAYEPACMEVEGGFKDPLKSRETEQEQEWKLRQQMRQKSKQQAKMEASQKLEQVKNEQRQQLAAQRLSRPVSPDNSSRSPMTPGMLGSASPVHTPSSRESQCRHHLPLQAPPGQADDVFLRPQAPPLSGFSSPLHQPPSSPQMFSPPSSRPSSPWDPLKGGGTSRPTSCQAGNLPGAQQQRGTSLSPSPGHDMFGSPAPSPDSKAPTDASRNLMSHSGKSRLQQNRGGLISPPSGSAPGSELLSRHLSLRPAESFQRSQNSGALRHSPLDPSGRTGDPVQGNLFKAPMPPQQEVCGGAGGGRRDPSRPTDLNFAGPPSQDPAFPSSPLSALGSPHRSPYAQMPGTPRPDYSQQTSDPFTQQSPPYINPQTPGTPRPHNTDPYSSSPGTPRPSVVERFPRSPGSQRSGEASSSRTPRPDQYGQQSPTVRAQKPQADGFTPQHVGPGSSPLASETFTSAQHQLSPGQPHLLESFPRNAIGQVQKHPGMFEASGFSGLAVQASPNPFEQGPVVPGSSHADKTKSSEVAQMDVASLSGPVSMLPQQGDSEEKLRQVRPNLRGVSLIGRTVRASAGSELSCTALHSSGFSLFLPQRQRLRQLILRQQQQKNVSRQEKLLQDGAAGPPHQWLQKEPTGAAPADPFGRPPPPYPGTARPPETTALRCAGNFTAEMARNSNEGPVPRQGLPREPGLQGQVQRGRFAAPPGGLQGSFLRMSHPAGPGSGLVVEHGVSVQMKRPGEFTGIRPVMAPGGHPFLPRSLPLQQHSIMGQPYIELRHRAPEHRLRLPFPPSAELQARPIQGPPLGQQMLMQQQHVVSSAPLSQNSESALPGAEGIEEHLEGEDSAVKDLEDVEVKDLVDLNLNLDPEDGKEDLDLGPNDLHLDDFLLSGKFDLIAYADPELNLEEKKDMFNEELDLGEVSAEEKEGGAKKADHLVKQEMQESTAVALREGACQSAAPLVLSKVRNFQSNYQPANTSITNINALPPLKVEESSSATAAVPGIPPHVNAAPLGMSPQVHPPSAGDCHDGEYPPLLLQTSVFTSPAQGPLMSPHTSVTPEVLPLPPPQPHLPLTSQTQTAHMGTSSQNHTANPAIFSETQIQDQNPNKQRPLLLEEQPLLLQDLLDQERQEQQQQKQMQALMRQRPAPESGVTTTAAAAADFDSISDPIMKAKMVALKGINKVMSQGNLGLNPMVINRLQQAPVAQGALVTPASEGTPQLVAQDEKLTPQLVRPNPPNFGSDFANESQRRQYEEWLAETQQLLQMQQRLLEDQIAAHRKTKKSLSAKQRTAKKAGRAFAEEDAAQLRHVTELQGTVQKQLEQIRKQQKSHTELIEDYRTKQQQQQHEGAATSPPSQPSHHASQTPPAWGSAAPVSRPQHQRWLAGRGRSSWGPPLALPNAPQAPSHTQAPGFTTGSQGPAGGPGGRAPSCQVNYDDNNPFSEGFQERERRERLREQQERQRVQLLQEVERQRALQQRMELEQQALYGAPGGPGESLSQMPFFSSEPPQDFLQTCPLSRPPQQTQGQTGSQHAGAHQGYPEGTPNPGALLASGLRPRTAAEHSMGHPEPRSSPRFLGAAGLPDPAARPLPLPEGQACRFGHEPSSSSPSSPLQCLSGEPGSLLKRKKRDVDDAGAGTPLSSHSDDVSASSAPAVLDHSRSGPTQAPPSVTSPQVKKEREEGGACEGVVKKEEGGAEEVFSPALCGGSKDGDGGKELLRHLLKDKTSHIMPFPTSHAPPAACRQSSNESIPSEEEDRPRSHGNIENGPDLLDSRNKLQRCKRPARPEKDRLPPKNKRRKKEDEELLLCCSSSEPILTHLAQNNLSNPPTPPASLPPTPPPLPRQKLMNGFATTDELTRKDGETLVLGVQGVHVCLFQPHVSSSSRLLTSPPPLPTPPHNNQEELKVQGSECEAADSYVPSSSPESVADMEVSRFPDLSFVKLEPVSPCPSPTLAVVPAARGKGPSAVKQEVKVEPNPQDHPSCLNTDLVTIAITVNPVAAQNIGGVMAAVAQLLRVPVPLNYQLSRTAGPDHASLALLAGARV